MYDDGNHRQSSIPPLYPDLLPQPQAGPYPPFPSHTYQPQHTYGQSTHFRASSSSDPIHSLYQGVATISMDGPDMGYIMVDERRSSGYDQLKPRSPPVIERKFVPETDPELNPGIAMTLPTATSLMAAMGQIDYFTDRDKLHWGQDVVRLLDKLWRTNRTGNNSAVPQPTPPQIVAMYPLISSAVTVIISMLDCPVPALAAAAYYIRAHLLSTGNVPEELELRMTKDARQAFKDFERAARGGEVRGWFRLGRDYEVCGELERAKNCYEKGAAKGDGECIYRLAVAHLGGQLKTPIQASLGLDYLRRSADMATVDCPQAAFFLGMLLAGENHDVPFPSGLLLPALSPASPQLEAQHKEAKSYILKAAYLCFGAALYKAGYMHEHAQLSCPYDPLLSVQYHALASQEGEIEADMALSKWFLVGAEGCFEKEETLSRTFADKAAQARLPTGLFALGYYNEVGIGGPVDIEQAKTCYHKAAKRGNQEAIGRLRALETPIPSALSGDDHMFELNRTLVRKHTTAKERSDRLRHGQGGRPETNQDALKRRMQEEASRASGVQTAGASHTDGMPAAVLNGYIPALTQQGPSHLPILAPQAINDWRATVPARQGAYPTGQHGGHANPIPPVPTVRPLEAQGQNGRHARHSSSSAVTTLPAQAGSIGHQQQYSHPPSSNASSAFGHGDSIGLNTPSHSQMLTPQPGRMASGSFADTEKPPRSSSQSTSLTDDSQKQRRQSYALHDPGATPVSDRPAALQSDAQPLHDPAKVGRQNEMRPPGRVQAGAYKGADTFEQMGFVSKPVSSDNDCCIM